MAAIAAAGAETAAMAVFWPLTSAAGTRRDFALTSWSISLMSFNPCGSGKATSFSLTKSRLYTFFVTMSNQRDSSSYNFVLLFFYHSVDYASLRSQAGKYEVLSLSLLFIAGTYSIWNSEKNSGYCP